MRAALHEWPQCSDDLMLFGESTGGVLRKHQVSIHQDVEDAVVTLDQLGLDSEFLREPGPQTGGLRKVVSTHAVRDRDMHRMNLLLQSNGPGAQLRSTAPPWLDRSAHFRC
jgi:hypothetical protein